MRVNELAQDLGVIAHDVLVLLRAMGIPVPDEGAPVLDADVARVLARVERERRAGRKDAADAVRAAIAGSRPRRRRRRRAADLVPEFPVVSPDAVPEEPVEAAALPVDSGIPVIESAEVAEGSSGDRA